MRTTKRFTPAVLQRFSRQGRGCGTGNAYTPWHRVGRGDPASRGRSHLQKYIDRQRELLSDGEWGILFFVVMLAGLVDIREQFPLSTEDASHELERYIALPSRLYPGTQTLVVQLGIKHPWLRSATASAPWIPTTDFLVTIRKRDGSITLLAIASKPARDLQNKRARALLRLERAYWMARDVEWILVTEDDFDERVVLTLRRTMPWGLGAPVSNEAMALASSLSRLLPGYSETTFLHCLAEKLGDLEHAQRAFWQAVWYGEIPLDLRRGWRPHQPLRLLSVAEFVALNPIASRRSSWN